MGPFSGALSGHLRGQLALINRYKPSEACKLLSRGLSTVSSDPASQDEQVEQRPGDQPQAGVEANAVNGPQSRRSLLGKLASDSGFVGASIASRKQQVRRNSTAAPQQQSTQTVPPSITTVAPTGRVPVKLHSIIPEELKTDMIEVFVDGQAVNIVKGMTVLQACDEAGVDIPRFCYHPRLSIAGNCRMCLVEVEKSPKPVASCAMPAMPGMKIKTNTPLVKKAREGVMEFLLLNHPLDCPICDQGGECDLQDQAMVFGSDRGRFTDMKRSVVDKHLGPLIKTVMTRCIHCTRCVRYATEIAGVEDLGVLGRGNAEEIGTYVDRLSTSEVSGNVIDLCPVGALTSKPYAFTARNWELANKESIDVSDALGANIRVDHRGPEVMRIVPRLNEDVNEEWLTDKGRFMYDGLKRQRLAQPYVRGSDGRLRPSDWREALQEAAHALTAVPGEEIAAVVGKLADVESITALKDLMAQLNCQRLYIEGAEGQESADIRPSYLFNTGIAALEDADAVLLVGTDLRSEAPLLNVRMRKAFRAGTLRDIAAVGPADMDLTYPHEHLGDRAQDLSKLTNGKDGFAATLAKAERPAIIVGAGVLRRADKDAILGVVDKIAKQAGAIKEGWNGLNVLQLTAGATGALDLGFVPGPGVKKDAPPAKVVYLLGADEGLSKYVGEDSFVIYQGHHGDQGASRASVVLPGAAYTEKEATYVNTEGRPQRTVAAVPVPGNAREDWKIIRALSEVAGKQLPYNTTDAVRRRAYEIAPHLERMEEVEVSEVSVIARGAPAKGSSSALLKEPFERAVPNFYMTDPISRASQTMARCTSMFKSQKEVDAQEDWLLHADWGKQKAAKQPAL